MKIRYVWLYVGLFIIMNTGVNVSAMLRKPIKDTVDVNSLLRQMVNAQNDAIYPEPFFTSKLESSHDPRSLVPGNKWWHSNKDDTGFIRYEMNNGREEKVLFDQEGPGVITRIITTGKAAGATLRIYFDNEAEASISIPFYDISRFPFHVPQGLLYRHEHYATTQGSSFYFPLPYKKRCKITVDDLDRGYYFHANYNTYPVDAPVKTFSLSDTAKFRHVTDSVASVLNAPVDFSGRKVTIHKHINRSSTASLELPKGSWAIRTLSFNVSHIGNQSYTQLTRHLIVKLFFDNKQTACVPLSDLSGGGIGAPLVKSYYLSSNGKGAFTIRFIMPYQHSAKIELENLSELKSDVNITAQLEPYQWSQNSLYFHATWRQVRGLETNKGLDFNNCTIEGKGVFKGDVLSVYNHMARWWGEGDEHIWVDHERFPSHFGCGTEDYYNTTFAPIHPYYLPFGGAPRADDEASRGYNNFLRTRNLDVVPFSKEFKLDFELISWDGGKVDFASTAFWYGDFNSFAVDPSDKSEVLQPLPPPVYTGDPPGAKSGNNVN